MNNNYLNVLNEYNGWTNYPTWVVNLHLNELLYDFGVERIREEIEEKIAEIDDYLLRDLLTFALGRVDWDQIQEHIDLDYANADDDDDDADTDADDADTDADDDDDDDA